MDNKKTIWIMTGPPGAGKSTYLQENVCGKPGCVVISRDAIRFSLIKEGEEYFSKEKEVFNQFINTINLNLALPDITDIYLDATFLSEGSRNKTLNKLNLEGIELNAINFNVSVEDCIARNENRSGFAYVPPQVIRRMSLCYQPATFNEKYKYQNIKNIRKEN